MNNHKLASTKNGTFLRWAGSKKRLIPTLSKHWNNEYDRYVEPFAGSACLFFNLSPSHALLGDINKELILTYEQIRANTQLVLLEIKKLKKTSEDYYRIRALDLGKLSLEERAARFIYLNRYCFNGLYRTNSSGKFNVPYCGDDKGTMPPDELFYKAAKLLENAQLVSGNFEKTLSLVKKGDFVYMDPPFSVKKKNIFNEYDPSHFSSEEISLLREWMISFNKKGIHFLVSYAESDEADFLKKGFYFEKVLVRRSIAGFISKRKIVNEVLIYNKSI